MKAKKINIFYYLFFTSLVVVFFFSMKLYLLWEIRDVYLSAIVLALGVLYYVFSDEPVRHKPAYMVACVFLFLFIGHANLDGNTNFYLGTIMKIIGVYLVLILPDEEKRKLLRVITKTFGIIMVLSLPIYLISLFIDLPSFGILSYGDGQYEFTNHIFYIKPIETFEINRFNSVFLEPGHMSMIAVFLLYANEFMLRENFWLKVLLVVAILITFSLGGYVLLVAGYLLCQFNNRKVKRRIRNYTIIAFVLMSAYYFALEYNQGDNVLNEAIVERLQYDEEKGIAGNNRTSEVVDIYFEDAIRFNEIWNGWGAEEYLSVVEADPEFVGAGYKVFLLRDGIVGAILIFLFYFLLARVGPQKKKLYLMLLLYAFCFLQRAYPTWEAWIFPFALGAVATTVSSKEKNGQKVTEA